MSDYRLISRVKNNRILSLIEFYEYSSVNEFCRKNNLSASDVGLIINMKLRPITAEGKYRTVVDKMATALKVHPDSLFSEEQRELQLERNVAEQVFTEYRLTQLVNDDPENILMEYQDRYETNDLVNKAIARLTPREQKVIKAKFGIGCTKASTSELVKEYDISKSRVVQVTNKAFSKLRRRLGEHV